MIECNHNHLYLFGPNPMCLHKLFQAGLVKIVVKEVAYNGEIKFYIYRDKPKNKSMAWKRKWWVSGARSRLRSRGQILLAIELSEKHQVPRITL